MNHPFPGRGVKTCQNISGNIEHTETHDEAAAVNHHHKLAAMDIGHGYGHGDTATLTQAVLPVSTHIATTRCVCQPAISRLGSVPVGRPGHGKPADDGQPCRVDSGGCFWTGEHGTKGSRNKARDRAKLQP